jgi:hypothetical protein
MLLQLWCEGLLLPDDSAGIDTRPGCRDTILRRIFPVFGSAAVLDGAIPGMRPTSTWASLGFLSTWRQEHINFCTNHPLRVASAQPTHGGANEVPATAVLHPNKQLLES